MYHELWQVPFAQHCLSGMRKPQHVDEVIGLKEQGVAAIITLLDDEENHDIYRQADMPFLWLPMVGGTAPTQAQVDQALTYVTQQMNGQADSATVAVHCSNGHKRTGTLLAALLIKDGKTADDAIATVIAANPKADGMNDKQRAFLQALYREENK